MNKKLEELLDQINREISMFYLPGTRKWIEEGRPDLEHSLRIIEDQLNESFLKAEGKPVAASSFIESLKSYTRFYAEATNLFKQEN